MMIKLMTVAAWLATSALPTCNPQDAHEHAVAGAAGGAAQSADDPLTRPIETGRAERWLASVPPERIFGNTYLVGFGGLSVVLIDTGAGLVLLDSALPQAAPMIVANVRRLGFNPADIKFILSTEPHYDHSGGLAALTRDTGATVVASARAADGLRAGALLEDDPQLAYGGVWPGVTRIRVVENGEVIQLGHTAITARATPGHTMGSMSWNWQACEGEACKSVVFAASLNPVSADGYRYTAPASAPILDGFAATYRLMDGLDCDILISAHPDNAGEGRYNDRPGACRTYVERSRGLLATRLANERSGTAR